MYRMSKKIAQLTKVIGMLVNKTEDNEYEMNHVHDAWEARVHELTDSTNAQVAEARRNMGADGQASHIVPMGLLPFAQLSPASLCHRLEGCLGRLHDSPSLLRLMRFLLARVSIRRPRRRHFGI